jgi:exonuclease SbcC
LGTEANRDELFRATLNLGLESSVFVPDPPLDTVDLALRTPCYQAFFEFVEDGSGLLDRWRGLQDRLLQYKQSTPGIPRDLYLAFVFAPETRVPWLELQTLASDPMVCRKLILRPGRGMLQDSFANLPFLKMQVAEAGSWAGADSILAAMESLRYPSDVLSLFRMRLSPTTITERLLHLQVPPTVPAPSSAQYRFDFKTRSQSRIRLDTLSITDFRGIRDLQLDLSGAVTVIYGRNGTGKTSIFEAIEWGLLGEVERLEEKCADELRPASPYVNLFSANRQTEVKLRLQAPQHISVQRSLTARDNTQQLLIGDEVATNEHDLLDLLCGEQSKALDIRHLRRLLRTTSFLSQTTIKRFLSNEPVERYWALSYLLGTHDFTQLIEKIEQVRAVFDAKLAEVSQTVAALTHAQQLTLEEIGGKQNLSSVSNSGQELSRRLEGLFTVLQSRLEALDSPFVRLVPQTSAKLEEVRSALTVISEWIQTAQKESQSKHSQLLTAKDVAAALAPLALEQTEARVALQTSEAEWSTTERIYETVVERAAQVTAEIAHLDSELLRIEVDHDRAERILTALQQKETLTVSQTDFDRELSEVGARLGAKLSRGTSLKDSLSTAAAAVQSGKLQLTEFRARLNKLAEAESLSVEWANMLLERPQLEQLLRKTLSDESELLQRRTTLLNERASLTEELKLATAAFETEIQSLERHRQLLVGLQEFLNDTTCPLCGHDWGAKDTLVDHVQARMQWESQRTGELRSQRRDLSARLEGVNSEVKAVEQEITVAGGVKKESSERLAQLRQFQSRFRETLEEVGIDLSGDQALVASVVTVRSNLEQHIATLAESQKQTETHMADLQTQQRAEEAAAVELEQRRAFLANRVADATANKTQVLRLLDELGFTSETGTGAISAILQTHAERRSHLLRRRDELAAVLQATAAERQESQAAVEIKKKKRTDLQLRLQQTTNDIERRRFELLGLGIDPEKALDQLPDSLVDLERRNRELEEASGVVGNIKEMSSLLVARQELDALHQKKDALTRDIENSGVELEKSKRWFDHISTLWVMISETKAESDSWQLHQYEPTINKLYERLSNHPIFRSLKIEIDLQARSVTIGVRLNSELKMDTTADDGLPPQRYLSEAQSNTVALSIFLSHSFQQRWSRFVTLLIDDPVQNMDDFNAAGFIDCVRAFADLDHQFVISTCDVNFYRLLLLKLRCLNTNDQKRFRAYRLEGISTEGPERIEDTP